ncbi:MAG: hypothetical protein F6K11_05370 [Leptolyngbya sp. SIO3F4]|nr:hypothetical protein [Leptolyngbya sp. SIO3F4]
MSEPNSTVERQIRPTELQEQLGIKKDTYYAYLKHLGIRAEKDSGKAFLTEIQAEQIKKLRQHVVDGGKIENFVVEESTALAMAESGELGQVEPEAADPTDGLDMELLYREASELAAHRLTAGEQVVMAMASQLTYDDLHPAAKAKVDHVRAATAPKFNAQEVAASLLSKYRQAQAA